MLTQDASPGMLECYNPSFILTWRTTYNSATFMNNIQPFPATINFEQVDEEGGGFLVD